MSIDLGVARVVAEQARNAEPLSRGVETFKTSGGERHTFCVVTREKLAAEFYETAPETVLALLDALEVATNKVAVYENVVKAARETLGGSTGWGGAATEPLATALSKLEDSDG